MALSDFLNGFTFVSLYSRCSLCSYQAAQKNLVLHKKLLCQQKKIFHIEINVVQQNYMSYKKICCGNKKKQENAMRCNNRDDLLQLNFKVSIFSEAYI